MTIRRRAKGKRVTIHERGFDPAPLDILSKDVLYWNDWRHAHPETVPGLDGADLSRMSLRDWDFRGAPM